MLIQVITRVAVQGFATIGCDNDFISWIAIGSTQSNLKNDSQTQAQTIPSHHLSYCKPKDSINTTTWEVDEQDLYQETRLLSSCSEAIADHIKMPIITYSPEQPARLPKIVSLWVRFK